MQDVDELGSQEMEFWISWKWLNKILAKWDSPEEKSNKFTKEEKRKRRAQKEKPKVLRGNSKKMKTNL